MSLEVRGEARTRNINLEIISLSTALKSWYWMRPPRERVKIDKDGKGQRTVLWSTSVLRSGENGEETNKKHMEN